MANSEILEWMFQNNIIDLHRTALFDQKIAPKGKDFDFAKVEGMLLGLAVGDALGATSEGLNPEQRQRYFGEITGYRSHPYSRGQRVGLPTDDTQLAFWTLETLIRDDSLDPDALLEVFSARRIYRIGSTVRTALERYRHGVPWYQCGPHSAGNGALMRIAPVLVPYLKKGGRELWADAALSAMATHNDAASISASIAFTAMLWEILDMPSAPSAYWWIERYVEIARDLEGETNYSARGGKYQNYSGPLWRFVAEKLPEAYENNLSTLDACDSWYSGAYLMETVPSVLYILMRHADSPRHAVVRAVNDTRDNDTVAAIVGAAVGALHGRAGIPSRWIEGLLGRTGLSDDGKVFELIKAGRKRFWAAS